MPASFSTSLPTATSLKRKLLSDDDHESNRPSKLPTIAEAGTGRPTRPLRQNMSATNVSSTRRLGIGPPPLTMPRPPVLSGPPPATITTRPISVALRCVSQPKVASRSAGTRTLSGPQWASFGVVGNNDFRFQALQSQGQSSVNLRTAENAMLAADMDAERTKVAALRAEQLTLTRELASARTQELSHRRELISQTDELEALRKWHARELLELEVDARRRERELHDANSNLTATHEDLERERKASASLKEALSQQGAAQISLKSQNSALQAELASLRAANDGTAETVLTLRVDLEAARRRIDELEAEAHEAEMVRRRLHNMVQELKGNIRVFARVRPLLPSDLSHPGDEKAREEALANMSFPDTRDNREIVLSSTSESATGQERKESWNFSFDRVFEPQCTQEEVFEEISQLAQSCTDGYNVCIFAYGQTGSGKSFTMEGGPTSETVGMIPRAVEQVFQVTEELKSKGWEYALEGQFLEIYNETINDLLGKGEFDKKKHEIKHEKGSTRVTDVVVQRLRSAAQVRSLLALANSRRTVAATLMNERSSRSHSVFTLRIRGTNTHTGQVCEGALNLVDLAADRLKETQNINKSLSALGDVIAALGEKSEKSEKHIPYRNSKLTYLLQNSLSGNSKTLVNVLNLSPLAAHLNESICSLRFATKVNNTQIGTAKKQVKSTS
ncbi:kinesin-domain-containing protein [Multifurca ochricompacta]|uniref:Kinesin-domain-containing protein n=1 Tax=Multifurca ochricompacta TaxID=376703 RepID=A0AAD4M9G4_9AGAM|nr:kinesin-domain-containing protein [Multifurca ochricompacta]